MRARRACRRVRGVAPRGCLSALLSPARRLPRRAMRPWPECRARVPAGSATVLGRACVLPVDAHGVSQSHWDPDEVFDDDLVLPAVPEVVFVREAPMLTDGAQQGHAFLVDLVLGIFVEDHPITVI